MPKVKEKKEKKKKKDEGGVGMLGGLKSKLKNLGKGGPSAGPSGDPQASMSAGYNLNEIGDGKLADILLREVVTDFNLNKFCTTKTIAEAVLVLSLFILYAKEIRSIVTYYAAYPYYEAMVPILIFGILFQMVIMAFLSWLGSLDVNQHLVAFYKAKMTQYQKEDKEPLSIAIPMSCPCVYTESAARHMNGSAHKEDKPGTLCWKCVRPKLTLRSLNYFCLLLVFLLVSLNVFMVAFLSTETPR